jgi:hypothetical protein
MAINLGALAAKRLERAYKKVGLSLVLTDGVGAHPFIGRVSLLVFDEQASHFTSAQTAGWARPAYKVQIAGDYRVGTNGPFVGDTVALPDGGGAPGATLDYMIRKVDRSLLANVVYRTTLYVSRNA